MSGPTTRNVVGCVALALGVALPSAWGETPYPAAWPRPLKGHAAGDCLSLSGKFRYHGDVDRADRAGPSTIDRAAFNRMSLQGSPQTAVFEHEPKTGVLRVQVEGVNVSPIERATFEEKLTCEDGWSVNTTRYGECDKAPPRSCISVRLYYTLAEDRSLIVRFTGSNETQPFFGGPKKTEVDAWYRFEATH
jgi:hypothetical protein